jgi:thioredoxin 1
MSAFKELINGTTPVIVHFSAEWAKPSEGVGEKLKEAKQELGDLVKMIKIDIDKNPDVASKFAIVGVPCLLLFKEGVIKWRHSGTIEFAELVQEIKNYQ